MSKRTLLIFIIPLILCLVGTFLLLKINQNQSAQTPLTKISSQSNFLLLQVDSLSDDSPEIVSAWAVLVRTEQPTHLIFKQLSPAQLAADQQVAISLDADGLATDKFLRYAQNLKLDLDSYFLLDSQAVATLFSDLTGQANPGLDEATLSNLCEKLGEIQTKSANLTLWNDLIPDHMRTNLSFESYATIWEKITRSGTAAQCKMISLQSENSPIP